MASRNLTHMVLRVTRSTSCLVLFHNTMYRISIRSCLPLFVPKQRLFITKRCFVFFRFQAAAALLTWSSSGSNSSTRRTRWSLRSRTSWWRKCTPSFDSNSDTISLCSLTWEYSNAFMQSGSDTAARRSITADLNLKILCLPFVPTNLLYNQTRFVIWFIQATLQLQQCEELTWLSWCLFCFFFSQVATAGARGQAEHAGVGAQEIHGAGWCVLQRAHISTRIVDVSWTGLLILEQLEEGNLI